MRKSVPNNQIRALAMAMAGAIVAAVATMFVPVALLEGIAGSSGLSELVPAARAPLGDTARALIAFGGGAFTLALLSYVLLRLDNSAAPSVPTADWAVADAAPSFKDRLANVKLPSIVMPKMPWTKGEDDITELADLPKLRNGDSHPDAPPRRPLVASQDLPVLDLVELPEAIFGGQAEVSEQSVTIEPAFVSEASAEPEIAPEPISVVDVEPTLAEMVAQLEAAVAERQKQLAELEAVATELAASRPSIQETVPNEPVIRFGESVQQADIIAEPTPIERPTLEAVPTTAVKDDDIDSALAAALATLHRMNATGR
jgi:hypothetical protein